MLRWETVFSPICEPENLANADLDIEVDRFLLPEVLQDLLEEHFRRHCRPGVCNITQYCLLERVWITRTFHHETKTRADATCILYCIFEIVYYFI